MKRQNQSMITEFILIGFSNLGDLQILLFFIFLLVYLTTLMANTTTMTVIHLDRALHTPMYFFLFVLSCSETCYTLVIVPKMLTNLLSAIPTISFSGCVVQLYLFVGLACTNCFLIAVMGYDRYVAICNPLNYTLIVSRATCMQLVLASSFCGFLTSVIVNILVFSVLFCASNRINHFFCDISPVIKLGCTDTNLKEMVIFFLSILVLLACVDIHLLHLHSFHHPQDLLSGRTVQSLRHLCFPPHSGHRPLWLCFLYLLEAHIPVLFR